MKLQTLAQLREAFSNPTSIDVARKEWATHRSQNGFRPTTPPLLSPPTSNAKLRKGGQQYGLHLLPHRLSGTNLCPYSTRGCRRLCLNSAGRGATSSVQHARMVKTRFLLDHPSAFARLLLDEVLSLPHGSAVRLNMTSDILWEQVFPALFERMTEERPDLIAYDYTKYPIGSRVTPSNYSLTYSASEKWTDDEITQAVHGGDNVTVVLNLRRKEAMPDTWNRLPVVDGDVNDARYEDPVGVIVGLRAKGKAFRSDSPFVREAV